MAERVNMGEMFSLSPEEALRAYGALQELRWRAEEGDDTARLSEEEEALRASLEGLVGDKAHEHVPWSKRESTELADDLRRLLAGSWTPGPHAQVVRTWLEVLRGERAVPAQPLFVVCDSAPGPGGPTGVDKRDLVRRLRMMVTAVEQGAFVGEELGLLLQEAARAVEAISCQFVELETAGGEGVGPSSGASWRPHPDYVENGCWRLGPFYTGEVQRGW